MAKNKRYSFTSEQAGLLFFAMVCAGVAIFLVITAHRSADIVDRSVYIEAEVTDVTEPVMRVTYHSKSRAGTKPSYSVEVYQDVEIAYSVGGKNYTHNIEELRVFSRTYEARNEEAAKGLARGTMLHKKYIYDPGDTLEIYAERQKPETIYLAGTIQADQDLSILIPLIAVAVYFLLLIPFRFENASGCSGAGVGFSLTGVIFLSLMCRELVNHGYESGTEKIFITIGVISVIAVVGGIALIWWDQKP